MKNSSDYQKEPNKKVGDKTYYKYTISSISGEVVKKSGLEGKKLKATAEKGKKIVEKES
jgi:hypothetical protein